MRRTLGAAGIALLALMLAATPALAVFTVHQEGRKTDYSYQLGNPDLGAVVNVKAGNLYEDQNDADGRDDYLRGGDRFTKISHALRIQIDFVQIRIKCDDDSYLTLRRNDTPVNSGTAREVVSNTPRLNLDEGSIDRSQTYQIVAGKSVRWANTGRLSRWVEYSRPFFDQDPRDAADLALLVSSGCQP